MAANESRRTVLADEQLSIVVVLAQGYIMVDSEVRPGMWGNTKSPLTRRDVIKGGATAAALAGVPGLTAAQADSIRYWNIHNSNERRSAIEPTVQSFQDSEGIQVNAQFIDNDDIEQQISSAIASNRLP